MIYIRAFCVSVHIKFHCVYHIADEESKPKTWMLVWFYPSYHMHCWLIVVLAFLSCHARVYWVYGVLVYILWWFPLEFTSQPKIAMLINFCWFLFSRQCTQHWIMIQHVIIFIIMPKCIDCNEFLQTFRADWLKNSPDNSRAGCYPVTTDATLKNHLTSINS